MSENIKRHNFGRLLTGITLAQVFLSAQRSIAADPVRPNVVMILADDLGYECMGANGGSSYQTPNFDRLCKDGIRFEHCYAQPLCTPSRVKLMTGMSNVRNYTRFAELDRSQTTFAQWFKQAGYKTCIAGKWQLGNKADAPQHFGFDESLLWQHTRPPKDNEKHDTRYPSPVLEHNGVSQSYPGDYGPDLCARFVCDFMEKNRTKPFLVYYPMILTHCPFGPTPDSPGWDPEGRGSLDYKGEPQYFGDMLHYADQLVGRILDKLDELGLSENTLVVFTGDNGTDQPIVSTLNGQEVLGGKGHGTDAGTRVPLGARWPGTIPPGQVSSDIVDFSDFFPTVCEAAGIPVPGNLDGRSFFPQLCGRPGTPRESIYIWFSREGGANAAVEFARNQKYKLYRGGCLLDMTDGYHPTVLDPAALDQDQKKIYRMLQGTLRHYTDARPAEMARRGAPPAAR